MVGAFRLSVSHVKEEMMKFASKECLVGMILQCNSFTFDAPKENTNENCEISSLVKLSGVNVFRKDAMPLHSLVGVHSDNAEAMLENSIDYH